MNKSWAYCVSVPIVFRYLLCELDTLNKVHFFPLQCSAQVVNTANVHCIMHTPTPHTPTPHTHTPTPHTPTPHTPHLIHHTSCTYTHTSCTYTHTSYTTPHAHTLHTNIHTHTLIHTHHVHIHTHHVHIHTCFHSARKGRYTFPFWSTNEVCWMHMS